MSTLKRALFAASLCFAMTAGAASGETPNFGKPIDEASIAPWDISILPDGTGLPKGSGTPAQGAPIFCGKMLRLSRRKRQGRRGRGRDQ